MYEKKCSKKGLVVTPILGREMNTMCQVQSISSPKEMININLYLFIKIISSNMYNSVQWRAKEVACVLDIFRIFGAQSILQSDNGREFANKIVQ